MLKKLACIGLGVMIVIILGGCNNENKISGYDKESNIKIEKNTETDNTEREGNNEIITLYCGVPFNTSELSAHVSFEANEIKAGEDLTKYEIQYVNYDGNTISPYLSTGKVEKYYSEYIDKECFLVRNVGGIAVSANVKPIEAKLEKIDEIPEKIFSLNPNLENYNTFKLYSTKLKSNGDKNYILEANYTEEDDYISRGKIFVLDSQYNHLATLLNTTYSNSSIDHHMQIANIDFDEDLEMIVFDQGIDSGGVSMGIFNFVGDKLFGDTMDDLGA